MLEQLHSHNEGCFFIAKIPNNATRKVEYNIESVSNSFEEILIKMRKYVMEHDYISEFQIIKKSVTTSFELIVECYVHNKRIVNANVYNPQKNNGIPPLGRFFLNLPTPFKRGDLLRYKFYNDTIFCLDKMVTWNENLTEKLTKGKYDDTDMIGNGYFIVDGNLVYDTFYDFDNWEYFDGDLKGMQRFLIGVSNFIKNKIGLDLLIQTYNTMKLEHIYLNKTTTTFSEKTLMLAGFNDNNDIE